MKNALPLLLFVGLPALAVSGALAGACDPVHDDQVSALGNDPTGQRNGQFHRAGQPCCACHTTSGIGGGPRDFSVAGTLFLRASDTQGLAGAQVTLTSTGGATYVTTTNQVGNFFIPRSEWQPVFPMGVTVTYQGSTAVMQTHVGREGSCAGCHHDPPGPDSPGHVYFINDVDGGPSPFPVDAGVDGTVDAGADAAADSPTDGGGQ
jgi:hypothetical protein